MAEFRVLLKEPKRINFIVSRVISIALDPVTVIEDLMKGSESGGFGKIQVSSIEMENGKKSTLELKEISTKRNIGLETARRKVQETASLCQKNTPTSH